MDKIRQRILRLTGLEKQSPYMRRYFYAENMRASIYMSVVVIVLEIWMIIRMIKTIVVNQITDPAGLINIINKYIANYLILLSAGILMLLYAMRFKKGWWKRIRWVSLTVIAMSLSVIVFEIYMLSSSPLGPLVRNLFLNCIVQLCAGIAEIILSVLLIRKKEDNQIHSLLMLYLFSFVSINFGIVLSANSYAKGEQILAFLTMVLFVVCLLTWRPIVGFLILTATYLVFFGELDTMVAYNTGEVGITESTLINGFTMWLSTLIFCVSNYEKIRSQAIKDENLEKVNAHLSKISITDDLTGIHNMLYFRDEAEKLINYVTTDRERVVYLFLDIENFKSYNEQYGFHAGNKLLIRFAHSLEQAFKGSIVARYSDDHFVVLTAEDGCEAMVNSLSEEIKSFQGEVQLSLKCGAYHPAGDESDPSLACDRARFACNSIKKHYDRNFRYYDKKLDDQFQLKQYIVNNIDLAIENGYIKVFYQPVVSTKNGCICGLEALARWQDPTYGLLSPGAFISILEEYRQIYKLDRYVVEQVCRDYRESVEKGEPFAPVSLNISRLDFEMCDIVGYLNEQAKKYNVPQNYLDVEITESALSDKDELLIDAIQTLHETGYNIWLDDFGSGYSSLNVLKDYHFDVLKIDMKFLSGFDSNEKTTKIINNIVMLTQQLSMVSLTEGVETKEQFDFLKSIGCDRAQGYLFGKPAPIGDLRQRIRDKEISVSPEFLNSATA